MAKTVNRFIIDSKALKPVLAKMGRIVNSSYVLPVLSNLYVKVTPGQAEFICTDTEITLYCRVLCESAETFELLIPYNFLSKIVALNPHCPLEISVGKQVTIKGPNDTYEIKASEKIEDYPKLQSLPRKNSVKINSAIMESLFTALSTTAKPAVSIRYSHVLLELRPKKVTVASSDGSYMVFSREFDDEQESTEDLLISQKVIATLEGCNFPQVFFHSKAIGFETPELTVVATRTEEKYANFRVIFPNDWNSNLITSRTELLEALGKCLLSSDQLHTTKVNLADNAQMVLSAEDNLVNIEVAIGCGYTGNVEETCINAEKLQRLLNQITAKEISIAIHDPRKAIVITSDEEPGYKGLIMPIANK